MKIKGKLIKSVSDSKTMTIKDLYSSGEQVVYKFDEQGTPIGKILIPCYK